MADNTTLNPGASGDVIRDLARTTGASAGAKTPVVQLDIGGPSTNPESLVTIFNGMPVQTADGADATLGAKADAPYTDASGAASGSIASMIKGSFVALKAIVAALLAPVAPMDRTVSGTLTNLNDAITLTGLNGQSSIGLQISVFAAGATFVMEYSKDNFATVKVGSYISPTGITSASPTTTGFYRYMGVSGYPQARLRRTDSAGGASNAVLTTSTGVDGSIVASAIAAAFQVTDNAVATATAPSYAAGTTNPLSMDLAGNLRVVQGAALPAGTNNIGSVTLAGRPLVAAATLTIQAAAYAQNACVGGVTHFTGVLGADLCAYITGLALSFGENQTGSFGYILFNANPSSSTFTDKTVCALSAADRTKILTAGLLSANSAVNPALGSAVSFYEKTDVNKSIVGASADLWLVIYCLGAPTFTTTSASVAILGGLGS